VHSETEFNIPTDAIGESDANHVIDGTRVAHRRFLTLVGEAARNALRRQLDILFSEELDRLL